MCVFEREREIVRLTFCRLNSFCHNFPNALETFLGHTGFCFVAAMYSDSFILMIVIGYLLELPLYLME